MKISYLLTSFIAWGCFFNSQALAATPVCATIPSCEELGYTMSTEQCAGSMLKCPFDQSKAFCTSYKQTSGICDVGMIYDSSKQKCYTGIPHGNAGSLYYIWERDGNDAIVTPLWGWHEDYDMEGSAAFSIYKQTLATNNYEFLTLAQIEQLIEFDIVANGSTYGYDVPRVMYMNGLNKIFQVPYKDPGISVPSYYSIPHVSITLSPIEYTITDGGSGDINTSIYKTKIAISPTASNVTEYTIDTMIPSSYNFTSNLNTTTYTCSSYRTSSASAQNYCYNNASGIASNSEVKEAFDNDPDKLKEFLTISGTTNQSHIIITREGCFYIDSGGTLKNIDNNATLNGIATTASSARNFFYFCKIYKE